MRGRSVVILTGLAIFVMSLCGSFAHAETRMFSWVPPTTYTDGSPIGSTPITYTAFWSASATLTNPHSLLDNGSATSVSFDPDLQGMTRGSTVYFAVYAIVSAVPSVNATTDWTLGFKTPNAPSNPRITWLLFVYEWKVPTS